MQALTPAPAGTRDEAAMWLRMYRFERRMGAVPYEAAEDVRSQVANAVCSLLSISDPAGLGAALLLWRLADARLADIGHRRDVQPYWQLGRVAFMPPTLAGLDDCQHCGANVYTEGHRGGCDQ